MFAKRIAEYLNTIPLPVSNITAYAESSPAPKTTSPQIVVVTATGGVSPKVRTQFRFMTRFVVSGTTTTAMAKAEELFRYFFPKGYDGRRAFTANEYLINDTLAEDGEPRLVSNNGNIFYASYSLIFLAARDT